MSKLAVGKIVATSTPTAWSQAYHAGGFTAVLSLTPNEGNVVEESLLHKNGKEILDTLIAEYFTLTTKNLDTVKAAVETTTKKVPEGFHLSMTVGAQIKNILYLVIATSGKVLLKRGEKLGVLIQLDSDDKETIESVSGYLQPDDLVILETEQFEQILPEHELSSLIDSHTPDMLVEMLAPKIHESQNGGASALIFLFHEEEESVLTSSIPHQEKEEEEKTPEFLPQPEEETSPIQPSYQPRKSGFHFSHMQKIFLTIALILAGVLVASIILFTTRQNQARQDSLFQSIYTPAKAKYDEGQSLLELNATEAISDFQSAKSALSAGENKFPVNSPHGKQITSLLSQVDTAIQAAQEANTTPVTKVPVTTSALFTYATKQYPPYFNNVPFYTQDDTNFYASDNSVIIQVNKQTGAVKKIITNNKDWNTIGAMGAYLGNIYLVDIKDGVLKYVSTGSGYTKTSYFSSNTPNFSNATSMAIDGSIWILSADGTIRDYLKGQPVDFSISGLDKPFNNPEKIVTSASDSNLYILDSGNSRVVVLDKNGKFIAQYQNSSLHSATGLDVDEAAKKAYVLASGVYQINLK